MKCDYSNDFLLNMLNKQLLFFQINKEEVDLITGTFPEAIARVSYCFSASTNKYYHREGHIFFNPFHSGQWCIFLYFLSNSLFHKNTIYSITCDKIYYLNRMLNGVDLFYEVNLSDIFMLDHPLGSVIGRGTFGNHFSFSQGCTVGNNKGIFPVIGQNVEMLANSTIIGNSNIGNNVIISANTYIKDQNIDANVIVFGLSPNLIIKPNRNA